MPNFFVKDLRRSIIKLNDDCDIFKPYFVRHHHARNSSRIIPKKIGDESYEETNSENTNQRLKYLRDLVNGNQNEP